MSVPVIGENPDGTWSVAGQSGSYPTRDMAARAAYGMPLYPVQQQHGPTTSRDVLYIFGAIAGIFILVMVIGGGPTDRKLKQRGYEWNGQDYEYRGGDDRQPAPAVRYQQPAYYEEPQPTYRQPAPAVRYQQRQVPPGCYYVVATGETHCPPSNRR